MAVIQQTKVGYERRINNSPEVMAVIKASERASVFAREIFLSSLREGQDVLGAQVKSNNFDHLGYEDVVTQADHTCDSVIKPILSGCKDIPILSEETVDSYVDEAKVGEQRWLIDPIDGTFCLKNGIPDFSITIALQEKAPDGAWKTQVGAVAIPMLGQVYLADEQAAYVLENGRAKSLKMAEAQEVEAFSGGLDDLMKNKSIEMIIYKKTAEGKTVEEDIDAKLWTKTSQAMQKRIGDSCSISFSTALMVAKIADGWRDGAILGANAIEGVPWDIDAAIHIAEVAGVHSKHYELDGEPVVLLANSKALLVGMEHMLAQEHALVISNDVQASKLPRF